MTVVHRTAFTPFTCEQMYDLVNDVETYPQFLPWCEQGLVLAAEPGFMQARLTVNKGPFHYSFTTANRLEPARRIELALVEGPFRRFSGVWRFEPADGGCQVDLGIEFEFASRLLGMAMAAAFRHIADSLVDAFKRRAEVVYGA